MIPAEIYQTVYLLFVLMLAFFNFQNYRINNFQAEYSRTSPATVLVTIIVIVFIGLRPLSDVFADMPQYYDYLQHFHNTSFRFNTDVENIIYDNMMMYLACNNFPYPLFYLFIAAIYFGCYFICIQKLFPQDTLIAFILFLSAFMSFTSSTNGIKAGAATAIFMVAVANYNNFKVWIPVLLVSWGFHHAMHLPIAAFLCSKIVKNPKYYFSFWFFCLLCAMAHITVFQSIFAGFTDEKGASYLIGDGEWGGKAGFRIDFVIYSTMPILVGWYSIIKYKFADIYYERILNIYMLTNGVWMLCMYMAYNNRLAALSWGMYVVVLFYPILRCEWPGNKNIIFRRMAWAHVGFTLFMHFIYYAYIRF